MKRTSLLAGVKGLNRIVNSLMALCVAAAAVVPFTASANGLGSPRYETDTGDIGGALGDGTHVRYYYDMDKAASAETQNWTSYTGIAGVSEMMDPVNGVIPDEETLRDVEEILMVGYPNMELTESVFTLLPTENLYFTHSERLNLSYDVTQRVAYNRLLGVSGLTVEDTGYFESTYGSRVVQSAVNYSNAILDEAYRNSLTNVNRSFWLINVDEDIIDDVSLYETPDGTFQSEPLAVGGGVEGASISDVNMPEGLVLKPLAFSDNGAIGVGDFFVLSYDPKAENSGNIKGGLKLELEFDGLESVEAVSFLPEGYSPVAAEHWENFIREIRDFPTEMCFNVLTRNAVDTGVYEWFEQNDGLAEAREKASAILDIAGKWAGKPWLHGEFFMENTESELADWCLGLFSEEFLGQVRESLRTPGPERDELVEVARAFFDYVDFLANTVFHPQSNVLPSHVQQQILDLATDFLPENSSDPWHTFMIYGPNPRLMGVAVRPYTHIGIFQSSFKLILAEKPVTTTPAVTEATLPKTTVSKTSKTPRATTAYSPKTTASSPYTTQKTTAVVINDIHGSMSSSEPLEEPYQGGVAGAKSKGKTQTEETSKTAKTSKVTTAKTPKTREKTQKTTTSTEEETTVKETLEEESELELTALTNESYWQYSAAMSESAAGEKLQDLGGSGKASKIGVAVLLTTTGAAILGVSKNYRNK